VQPVLQPLVRTNPDNGTRALYFHPVKTENIVGMSAAESQALLNDLLEHSVRDEFTYRHQWRKGDVALWDNYGTLHYGVTADLGDAVRRLYRVAAWSKNVQPSLDRAAAVRELIASGT